MQWYCPRYPGMIRFRDQKGLRRAVISGWREIDIHGCYSLVKIAFAPICMCN